MVSTHEQLGHLLLKGRNSGLCLFTWGGEEFVQSCFSLCGISWAMLPSVLGMLYCYKLGGGWRLEINEERDGTWCHIAFSGCFGSFEIVNILKALRDLSCMFIFFLLAFFSFGLMRRCRFYWVSWRVFYRSLLLIVWGRALVFWGRRCTFYSPLLHILCLYLG